MSNNCIVGHWGISVPYAIISSQGFIHLYQEEVRYNRLLADGKPLAIEGVGKVFVHDVMAMF